MMISCVLLFVICIYWYILFQLTEKEDASSNGMNNFGFKGLQSYLPSSRQAETQEQVSLLEFVF